MVKPTTNVGLISKILGKPLTSLPTGTVFLLLEAEEIIGLALLTPWDGHLGMTDVIILEPYKKDKESQVSVAKYFKHYLDKLPLGKIIGMIPVSKPESVAFLQRAGFKREGVIKNSCVYNGEVVDQTIVGYENGNN